MKKTNYLLGALGFLALGFVSCSSDDIVNEPQKVDEDKSCFMAVTLSAPSEGLSRAFDNGIADESYVYCLDFLFYDVNGNPVGTPAHIGVDGVTGLTFTDVKNDEGKNSVSRFCASVVPVELTQGENLPAQVICIVNGNQSVVTEIAAKPLNSEDGTGFRDITQQEFSREGKFLMTNSVYYGLDPITGRSDQRLCATAINANTQLFGTRTAAEDALKSNTPGALVDIYVERVAAKVTLDMATGTIQDYVLSNGEGNGTVTLKYVPEYWLMNAVDKNTYLTKRFGVQDSEGAINMYPDFSTINGALTTAGFTNWNDTQLFRSYWGTSPSYFVDKFPMTSDEVFDPEAQPDTTYDPYDIKINTYPVNYFSYQSVVDNINRDDLSAVRKQWKVATNANDKIFDNSIIYTRETTTPQKTINNDLANGNPAATVGSAVILGHYLVNNETTGRTFYVDRNNGENGTFYGSHESALKALVDRQSIIFLDAEGQDALDANDVAPAVLENFAVQHPAAAVRALIGNPNVAGRLVTIQLNTVPNNVPLYYYDGVENKYKAIDAASLNAVNAQLVSTGYFDMFYNGLGFFSIPIRHLNFNTDSYSNKNGIGTYNWKTMKVGELGIVRNHAYTVTVTSIKGLANGLRSVQQPILPAKETVNQYVSMRLNILAWNIANVWSVEL